MWQPIETAPKDGRPLLLFSPYDENLNCAGGLIWVTGGWGKAAINPDEFRGQSNKEKPTHWMPLPASPAV
jgi:hypothetical protein